MEEWDLEHGNSVVVADGKDAGALQPRLAVDLAREVLIRQPPDAHHAALSQPHPVVQARLRVSGQQSKERDTYSIER
jgi:hypothetical protein